MEKREVEWFSIGNGYSRASPFLTSLIIIDERHCSLEGNAGIQGVFLLDDDVHQIRSSYWVSDEWKSLWCRIPLLIQSNWVLGDRNDEYEWFNMSSVPNTHAIAYIRDIANKGNPFYFRLINGEMWMGELTGNTEEHSMIEVHEGSGVFVMPNQSGFIAHGWYFDTNEYPTNLQYADGGISAKTTILEVTGITNSNATFWVKGVSMDGSVEVIFHSASDLMKWEMSK